MSLFGNLFSGSAPDSGGGLFSDSNLFRADKAPPRAATAQPSEQPKAAAAHKPSKQPKQAAAEAGAGKKAKEKKRRKAEAGGAQPDADGDQQGTNAQPAVQKQQTQHKAKDKQRAKKGKDESPLSPPAESSEDEGAQAAGPSTTQPVHASAQEPAKRKRKGSKAEAADSDTDSDDAEPSQADAKDKKPKLTPEEHAERLRRTIWVGNLPPDVTRKALKTLFARVGKVESARLRSVPLSREAKLPRRAAVLKGKVDTSRAPPIGYVVFESESSVTPALELNMTEMDGHHIQVDRAAQPSKQSSRPGKEGDKSDMSPASHTHTPGVEYDPQRTLFCGNCHFHLTNEELIQFFTNDSALDGNPELAPAANGGKIAVEACRIVRDPATNIGKGFAFVLFRTKAAARAAMSLNGKDVHGRAIRLTRVSVQQQKKLHQLRTAVADASKPRGQPPRDSASKGKGQKPAGKGPAGRSLRAPDPDSWQGAKTKGKGKDLRGAKAKGPAVKGFKEKSPLGGLKRAGGKRPSVAARKAGKKQQQAGGGKGSVPRPSGVKKPQRKSR